MVDGHAKGAAFERAICQRLSLWVSNMQREDVFWRQAMSGGRATIKSKRGRGREFNGQVGDIAAVHELGNYLCSLFAIDCKFYKDLEMQDFCWESKGTGPQAWEKLYAESLTAKKAPIMLAKQNRKQELVCTSAAGFKILSLGVDPDHKLKPLAIFPRHDMTVIWFREMITEVNHDRMRDNTQSV